MKAKVVISSKWGSILAISLVLFFVSMISYANEDNEGAKENDVRYPLKVEIIERKDAKYDTPKNAFIAQISALIK